MLDTAYRKRLAADLPAWRAQGWIGEEGATAILASLGPQGPGLGLTALVAALGSLLLGLGALGLVAANWEEIPRLVRFVVLVAAMGGAHLAAGGLRARRHPALAEAALLLAGLVFAAAIALVGQSYHLAGEFADAILLWALGCLGAAILARSAMMTVLALAGAAYWTGTVTAALAHPPHLAGLALILAGGAVALRLDARTARGAAILATGGWIVMSLVACALRERWSAPGTVAVGVAAALALWALGTALAGLARRPRLAALGHDLVHPALAAALAGLAMLQVRDLVGAVSGDRAAPALVAAALVGLAGALAVAAARLGRLRDAEAGGLVVVGALAIALAYHPPANAFLGSLAGAALVLAAALATLWLGQSGRQVGAKRLGLAAFGIEVAYVYVVTLGTILDTALSLIAGGLLFMGLAALLIRVNRALAARATQTLEAQP